MPIQTTNPTNGMVLRSFEPLTQAAISGKLALAQLALREDRGVPLDYRALWMRKLAGILEHETEELATLLTTEMGKTIVSARQEILKCAACCRYYAENAERMLAPETIETGGNESYVRWEPMGVVLAVMPWNFPFWQVFRFLAPALMAGNVGLLKHASNVPQCALAIESLVRRAGFPRGTFQALLIESGQVEAVLGDARVAAVTVTGSEAAGRAIAAQAGWLVKKSVLELGGSDPFIVMPSANMEAAINAGVKARTMNNGQSCIAAKRFVIHEAVYEEFEMLFSAAMETLRVGDPMKEDTEVGPLATEQGLLDIEAQVAAAVKAGGRITTGGERMLGAGNFFEPTVIADLPRAAAVYRDEIFGPVAMLFRAKSLDEAIEIANDTPFGLGASVWTKDADERGRFVAELQCGGVFVNTPVVSDARLPFGGTKRSGYGRELSVAGMREFMNAKTVVIAEAVEPVRRVYEPIAVEKIAEEKISEEKLEQPEIEEPEIEDSVSFRAVPVMVQEKVEEKALFRSFTPEPTEHDFKQMLEKALENKTQQGVLVLMLCALLLLT
ncbi:NAD-dependent succinate-semialdehyde dehydrogenase [Granulicella tundricola]|uniref:Aldehyde Dehydrogenase n=1 Tax=Granulicella tundricola (strain ATCC BAA-1859 / DSM 23138 / MP5ACTX9) TaxID=1198114 RepID=E8WYY4_GRATM|nr:aldehyde dehydrogenase family protein [Granulicella tundricola]ADW69899.1 Aldehyde Dehydrogenase [Granulicella tundricola MP5ACTX9]